MGSWSWRIRGGAKERERTRLCPSALLVSLVCHVMISCFSISWLCCWSGFVGLFSDNLWPFYQHQLFMFVDPITSFHPFPQPVSHPCPQHHPLYAPPILGSHGIHDCFSYLFGFWTFMELGGPEVVNFTRKLSSIFSIRILSSVFSPPSRLPYPLAFPPVSVFLLSVCLPFHVM